MLGTGVGEYVTDTVLDSDRVPVNDSVLDNDSVPDTDIVLVA